MREGRDASSPASAADRRYRQAALAYAVLGGLVILLTVASPGLLTPERRADLVRLAAGLPVFALFALAIAFLDRAVAAPLRAAGVAAATASRAGLWCREKLTMLVALTALVRTGLFLLNGLGQRPRLNARPAGLSLEPAAPSARMLLAAALMAAVFVLLARAAWLPFVARLGARRR